MSQRIRALMAEKKISVSELALRMSVSQSAVSHMLKGNPTRATLEKIAKSLNVPVSELLGENLPSRRNPDYVYLPILDAVLSAGPGAENHHALVEDCFIMKLTDFRLKFPCVNPANVCIVKVRGDSMMTTFLNNDLVLVDTLDVEPRDGIFALTLEGHQYVKRLQQKPGGKIMVVSDNPKYSPTAIDEYSHVKIDGHIIGGIMVRSF